MSPEVLNVKVEAPDVDFEVSGRRIVITLARTSHSMAFESSYK